MKLPKYLWGMKTPMLCLVRIEGYFLVSKMLILQLQNVHLQFFISNNTQTISPSKEHSMDIFWFSFLDWYSNLDNYIYSKAGIVLQAIFLKRCSLSSLYQIRCMPKADKIEIYKEPYLSVIIWMNPIGCIRIKVFKTIVTIIEILTPMFKFRFYWFICCS